MATFNDREDIQQQLAAFYIRSGAKPEDARHEARRVAAFPYFVIDDGDLYAYHSSEDARAFCIHFEIPVENIETNPQCSAPQFTPSLNLEGL
jgi:hypothetical protein